MEQIPKLRHSRRGLVSMVNNGSGLIGSQFFITLADDLDFLDGKHCIFGQVVEGMETVEKLNAELVNEQNKPYRDIRFFEVFLNSLARDICCTQGRIQQKNFIRGAMAEFFVKIKFLSRKNFFRSFKNFQKFVPSRLSTSMYLIAVDFLFTFFSPLNPHLY